MFPPSIPPPKKEIQLQIPGGESRVLLHSCCAPCSTAIIECLLYNNIRPTIFYYNPNIHPKKEYEIRKKENIRYAKYLNLDFIDADYDAKEWLQKTVHLKDAPERGARCRLCFLLRLKATAAYASENGFKVISTTLASSRWKILDDIFAAGRAAAENYPSVTFWEQNWRKYGLSERKNLLTQAHDFYRQQYCGCAFSLRDTIARNKQKEEVQVQS
ncbi:MAG: diacylglucosamine hydrolase [Bacteroidia bacterium]|nr:MAG: diacylglucosamine hydrolase [Bacteroidia bacterium]